MAPASHTTLHIIFQINSVHFFPVYFVILKSKSDTFLKYLFFIGQHCEALITVHRIPNGVSNNHPAFYNGLILNLKALIGELEKGPDSMWSLSI